MGAQGFAGGWEPHPGQGEGAPTPLRCTALYCTVLHPDPLLRCSMRARAHALPVLPHVYCSLLCTCTAPHQIPPLWTAPCIPQHENEDLSLYDHWEPVTAADVQTPNEVYAELRGERGGG